MGYFSNGTENEMYLEKYCYKCRHYIEPDKGECPIMMAHAIYNYDECNNKDSILHLLIPRDEEGWNKKCELFIGRDKWNI